MKMPPANSRLRKIIDVLLGGAVITPQEGIALHGALNLTVAEVAQLYSDLVVRGCAERVGLRIQASPALLERYELLELVPAPRRPLVPARTAPPFRPLERRHIPSVRGLREGSNDLRAVPSLYSTRK